MTDYRCVVHGRLPSGSEYSWALNITSNQTAAALVTTMSAALTDMWSNGTYGLGAQYHVDTTLDGFDVYTLNGTFKATAKDSLALSLVGSSGDNPLADATTLTVKKSSTSVQRNGRGFLAMPAPVEGTIVAGFYSSATRTRFQQALEAVLVAIHADGSTIFVHTGATATKGGVAPYTKTVISAMHASNKPGTRRQRTRKQIGVYV